jgi:hypothetical protein
MTAIGMEFEWRDIKALHEIRAMREKQLHGCNDTKPDFDEAEHKAAVAFERSRRRMLPSRVFWEGNFPEQAGRLEA